MDYLSLKFLNRGPDPVRNSDERLRKPQPLASPASATAAPSPTSIKTSHSANSHHASPHSNIVLPNTDLLPTSFAALEGHLNHHASQLQQLADRVESINEWIELDNIVLARLIRDEEKRVEDAIAAERAFPNGETSVVPEGEVKAMPVSPTSGLPLTSPGEKWAKRSASMGDVPRSPSQIPRLPPRSDKRRKEDAINSHSGVREVRERIRAMRRSRKEFEKAVFWQRAEFWRVQERMGKGGRRESVLVGGDENSLAGAETGGLQVVGEMEREQAKKAKWSRETAGGVLPSQREWEVLFS